MVRGDLMSKMKIWLAGKMSGLTYHQMNDWRVIATNLLKNKSDRIHTINPVSYYNFEMDKNEYTEKEIMKFDLQMVKNSDLILVNLENPDSIGTAIELFSASEVYGIPVIGFGIGDKEPHPWMLLCIDKICNQLNDAVNYIGDYYLPNM
jgi:nucleoside 2-deoxyribosyltransferase